MRKVIIIILLFSSVCSGDVFDSHLIPRTDSALDIGSMTLLWRFIYGDIFTDGTAYWESSQLYGFDEIDADSITAHVTLYGETITGHELTVSHIIVLEDLTADEIFGTTITGTTLTDGTFVVSGGEISAGEIVDTFGDINIQFSNLDCWDFTARSIIVHTTSDPQLILRHTFPGDEAGFYVDSFGDLTITPTGGDISLPATVDIDEMNAGSGTFGNGGITDYTHFGAVGEMTMHGDARVTKHLVIGAASWKKGATAPTDTYENIFPTISFNTGQDDEAHYTALVPSTWDNTTDMQVHVRWQMPNDADNGNVFWKLKYIGVKPGENPAGAGTEITQLSAGNHPEHEVIDTIFSTKMLAANLERFDDLGLMLWRHGTDGSDDLGEDAELIALHIHYTMDRFGEITATYIMIYEDDNVMLYENGDTMIYE